MIEGIEANEWVKILYYDYKSHDSLDIHKFIGLISLFSGSFLKK